LEEGVRRIGRRLALTGHHNWTLLAVSHFLISPIPVDDNIVSYCKVLVWNAVVHFMLCISPMW